MESRNGGDVMMFIDWKQLIKEILAFIGGIVTFGAFIGLILKLIRKIKKLFSKTKHHHIEHSIKLKNEFMKNLPARNKYGNRGVVIIRDLSRLDEYPDIEDKKGISSWFKVEVKDLYYKGIEVFLSIEFAMYNESKNNWELTEKKDGDNVIKVWAVGRIPYNFIDRIDWNGDEFYNIPFIYCNFYGPKNQPYEEIPFYHDDENLNYLFEIEELRPWDKKPKFWFKLFR